MSTLLKARHTDMQGVFVTGTDTGVGKTLVAGALAAAARLSGARVGVFKPCESGCVRPDGSIYAADAAFLKRMSGSPAALEQICPYRLSEPLAPAVAAERENVSISTGHIEEIFWQLCAGCDAMIAEGAGGLLVPMADGVLTLDIIRLLGLPVLVVARLSLGTINHCLLTVRQLQAARVPLTGIVFSRTQEQMTAAEQTNPAVLQRYTDAPVLGCLPFLSPAQQENPDELARIALSSLNTAGILPGVFR
jgi:dethiobiotin synthetase